MEMKRAITQHPEWAVRLVQPVLRVRPAPPDPELEKPSVQALPPTEMFGRLLAKLASLAGRRI